jgi:hypothetical protein
MRWYLVFMSTIFIWIFVTMPDLRREGQHQVVRLISRTISA